MRRDAATERQVRAADPGQSTWLSANAGSGKTRVLTDRVARLLLQGVLPQHVLCLTYTKAAASEMQNRLFRRLGEWAMLEDAVLRSRLEELGLDRTPGEEQLREARRLFARAIETPGGLKIQTIHSFCASLLRRFPLEAGVSPQFSEMDERSAARLRQDILDDMAEGAPAAAFDGVAAWLSGDSLEKLTAEVVKHRGDFDLAVGADQIWGWFGLPAGLGEADVLRAAFPGGEAELIARLMPLLLAGSSNDRKEAAKLQVLDLATPTVETLAGLEGVLLTGAAAKQPFSAKTGSFPTKTTRDALGSDLDTLEALMLRVEASRGQRVALLAARKTLALHQFAAAFLPLYAERKLLRGWLDFDDLILKARALLTDPGVAEWVLFRLDGGIDHILVDEAQDTSPEQWQVIDLLSREFTAGAGARSDVQRTIFVVGDKKQSIYSFQGADPDRFDLMQAQFADRLAGVARPLQIEKLEYSFRSSIAILGAVDQAFHEDVRRGVGDDFLHRAFHGDMPGRVDMWPVIEKSTEQEEGDWTDPVDMVRETDPDVRLAQRVACEIRRMIDAGETLWEKKGDTAQRRRLKAGDVMILVQRRSALFHEIIRACKAEGLPIAGADRLKIGGELAVKDLTALLSFLALPEDSLSLAAVLRSPLAGWDEAQLFRLAAGRSDKFLWQSLRQRKTDDPTLLQMLDELLNDADFLRPYDLIDRILTRHDGRRRLIARLGPEAEDGIDALLSQALAYEQVEVPSLTGFLVWLESGEVEIKRQLDSAGDRIRVMTVHGAKGLEAPLVILPDTGKRNLQLRDEILLTPEGRPLWRTGTAESPEPIAAARQDATRKQEEENQRLLYVAMTRAEQWLITCAAGDLGKGETWYAQIAAGMERAGAVANEFEFGSGLRLEFGDWKADAATTPTAKDEPEPAIPAWARERAEAPQRPAAPLSPTGLGGAKVVPGAPGGEDDTGAKRRGSLLHMLLEHLPGTPREAWTERAGSLLRSGDTPASAAEIDTLLAETEAVIASSELAPLFAESALTEVDLSASLPALGGQRMAGTIDRLILRPGHILAIDYKSNTLVPATPEDTPEGLLRQMGAYASALQQIYPGHVVETAILWTRTASLMPLPSQLVAEALARATTS